MAIEADWVDGASPAITAARLNERDTAIVELQSDVSALETDVVEAAGTATWAGVTGKPAVIGAGADQAAARTAIGAGTSSLAIGTTGSTAAAGDRALTAAAVTAVGGLTAIADPETADVADVAAAVNAIIAALKA